MRPLRIHHLVLSFSLTACGAAVTPPSVLAPDAASLERRSAVSLYDQGRAAAERGDDVRAEQYLLLAIQRGYDRQAALPLLLSVCISSMHLRTALDHAEPALREHPEDGALRYLVATIHLGLGQKYEARTELERLVLRDPEDAAAHFLLGVLETDVSVARASEHLGRYLALAPDGRRAAEAQSRLSELAMRDTSGAGAAQGRRRGRAGR